jgi:predicted kinase
LARRLGAELGWPVLEKDAIKERLFEELGTGDRAWSKRLGYNAIMELFTRVEAELAGGRSVVAEANFEPTDDLARIVAATGACCVQVVLHSEVDAILERFRRRDRHPGHLDERLLNELAARVSTPYVPLDLPGPLIQLRSDA